MQQSRQQTPEDATMASRELPEAKKRFTTEVPSALEVPSMVLSAPRKVSHCDGTVSPVNSDATINSNSKRPQMRYEPDIPMTKEEAAVWRREQRRKRNRESAAASRQRQRDRITELEDEVDDWKVKFQESVDRLTKLESLYGNSSTSITDSVPSMAPDMVASASFPIVAVSPCPSPEPFPAPSPSEMLSSSFGNENIDTEPFCASLEDTEQHLKEKNSLPAVKIAGAYQKPPMSNNFVPDQCSSMSKLVAEKEISASVSPTTRKSECLEDIQRLTDEELEFDEFLMDAAEWL